jgi:hypothetical protein
MKTGFISTDRSLNERIRLTEFSLLLASLGVDTSEFAFISHEAQGGHQTDIEAIRTLTARTSKREDRVVAAHLPSFKNHFPDSFFVEQMEESDHHPGVMENKYLEFWSAFDTVTYRFWIAFHILKLRLLFCIDDPDTELLYWERFGGELPSVAKEDRRFLFLLRLFAPFFRGRRLLYERVLPAFLKKEVTVRENVPHEELIPAENRNRLGQENCLLGRTFFPGFAFTENFSSFELNINGLDLDDLAAFAPGGSKRVILDNLTVLFAPAHLRATLRFNLVPRLAPFVLGNDRQTAYLGFSTVLRETV